MRTLVLLMVFCPMLSFGYDRLAALSMIETGNNDRMVGRAGEISRYQILKREWRSVTNSTRFTDPKVAEAVTRRLLEKRLATFRSIFGRNPTDFEFYGLWNAPSQVYRGRVSPVVAERCRRFANLCEDARRVQAAQVASANPAVPAAATSPAARAQAGGVKAAAKAPAVSSVRGNTGVLVAKTETRADAMME